MAKDKKINLLFDATIIVNAYDKKTIKSQRDFFCSSECVKATVSL